MASAKAGPLARLFGKVGVNPDQRMQADAQHLTELSAELSVGLLRALFLLVGFAGVLWLLSDQVLFTVHDQSFTVPGYLFWCALAYAASGSWLTWGSAGRWSRSMPSATPARRTCVSPWSASASTRKGLLCTAARLTSGVPSMGRSIGWCWSHVVWPMAWPS